MTTNNLTEQWKKGELEEGWYYANNDGERIIIYIFEKNGSVLGDDFDLKATDWIKPIAPVPSLEQWQQMKAFCEEFNALNVAEENKKLKELLNEIDKVYSSGVSRSDIEEDEYVIYHYTFKKLDELFNKWEKMKND